MLPDVLEKGMKIVFCGTAAGSRAAEPGLYYGNPGDKFWGILHKVGLTPKRLAPKDYTSVKSYGIGLTDLSGVDRGIPSGTAGVFDYEVITGKISCYRPAVLCFNGKKTAKGYFRSRNIEYGFQGEKIGDTKVFVAPSTSGSASRYWDEKFWFMLADSIGANVKRVSRANYYQPDNAAAVLPAVNTVGQGGRSDEDGFLRAISGIHLHYSIPLQVRNMFEIARALFAYGYLYYPFCALSIEQALKSLEAVVSHKYDNSGGPEVNDKGLYPVLAEKINYLYTERLITRSQKEVLHECRQLRNMAFHPKHQQVLGHYDQALITLARLINEIWTGKRSKPIQK